MNFMNTDIPGVVLIEPQVFSDDRGFFMEVYHQKKFADAGLPLPFVQDNVSHSARGVLRGLHAQLVMPQGKLIRVLSGEIFDVVVDLRLKHVPVNLQTGTPTFGRWFGVRLTAENNLSLYVPPYCAHGFYVLSESADVEYKCTALYDPEDELTIRWDDPRINIAWPLVGRPILSPKDANAPLLPHADTQR